MEVARAMLSGTLSNIMQGWIDDVLEKARASMQEKGLNEISLPSEDIEVSQTVLGIPCKGVASVYDGVLRGLETIHRIGPVNIAPEAETGDWIADIELGVDNPSTTAKTTAKFMNMGPTANVTGGFDKARVKMAVRTSLSLSGLSTKLETFEMSELGKLSMDVDGLGEVLNFLVEIIVETLGNNFRQEIREKLETKVKEIVNELVANPPSIPDILNLIQSSTSGTSSTATTSESSTNLDPIMSFVQKGFASFFSRKSNP